MTTETKATSLLAELIGIVEGVQPSEYTLEQSHDLLTELDAVAAAIRKAKERFRISIMPDLELNGGKLDTLNPNKWFTIEEGSARVQVTTLLANLTTKYADCPACGATVFDKAKAHDLKEDSKGNPPKQFRVKSK